MRRTTALGGCLAFVGVMAIAMGAGAQDAPHPAHIHVGVCPAPGDVVVPLTDLTPGTEASEGLASAIPVEVSVTTAEMALADILAGEHSINVHESADALDVYIACGDIGGPVMAGTDLAIGLATQNASGHSGVAWLHDNGDGTTAVYTFLTSQPSGDAGAANPAPEASPMPDASPAAYPGGLG